MADEDTTVHPTREEIIAAGGAPPDAQLQPLAEDDPLKNSPTREQILKAGGIPPDPEPQAAVEAAAPQPEEHHAAMQAENPKRSYRTRAAKAEE